MEFRVRALSSVPVGTAVDAVLMKIDARGNQLLEATEGLLNLSRPVGSPGVPHKGGPLFSYLINSLSLTEHCTSPRGHFLEIDSGFQKRTTRNC